MAKAGERIDESVPCRGMGGGEATGRLIDVVNASGGYRTISVGHDRLQFARTFRPTWAVVCAVLFTPIAFLGLFLLLVRTTETCLVVVENDHKGTRFILRGRLRSDVLGSIRAAFSASSAVAQPLLGAPVSSAAEAPRHISFAVTAPEVLISSAPASVIVDGVGSPGRVDGPDTPPAMSAGSLPPAPLARDVAARPSAPSPAVAAPSPTPTSEPWWSQSGGQVADLPPPTGQPIDLRSTAGPSVLSAPSVPSNPPAPDPADGADWVLQFDDGRCVAFAGFRVVLIGRDPTWGPGDEEAGLIAVDDPSRSVSKTHLAIGLDPDGPWVVDRSSTNGTSVYALDGSEQEVAPGEPRRVQRNGVIRFGTRHVRLAAVQLEEAS